VKKAHKLSRQLDWATSGTVAAHATLFLVNYNTIEAVLLGSAILVNLAGIMFESDRFIDNQFADQADTIAVITMIIICASIAYFILVFGLEVYSLWLKFEEDEAAKANQGRRKSMKKLASSKKKRKVGRKTSMFLQCCGIQATKNDEQDIAEDIESGRMQTGDDDEMLVESSEQTENPLQLLMMKKSNESDILGGGNEEANSLFRPDYRPNTVQWSAACTRYMQVLEYAKRLKGEVDSLQKASAVNQQQVRDSARIPRQFRHLGIKKQFTAKASRGNIQRLAKLTPDTVPTLSLADSDVAAGKDEQPAAASAAGAIAPFPQGSASRNPLASFSGSRVKRGGLGSKRRG